MSKVLEELVKINTVCDKDNEKMRNYIKKLLAKKKFEFLEYGEGREKVLLLKRGDAKVMFCCHTDTVDGSKLWTKDIFKVTEDDNYYFGLGVSDMKGGIAALLEVVLLLPDDVSCMICFTYDEERGFTGIKKLINEKVEVPNIIIFPEPTDLYPVVANKGCLEYKIEFYGKSAHSSVPMLGDNALYKAISFIEEVKNFSKELEKEKVSIYDVSYTTFNLSRVWGGEEINKVPDYCEVTFDFRTIKRTHNIKIKEKVDLLVKKYNASMQILNNIDAVMTTDKEVITKIERIVGKKVKGLNYATEASFFPDKQIIILGPGPITAHQIDEKISKDSFIKCQELYKDILLEM